MKIILILLLAFFIVSCNKNSEKTGFKNAENIKTEKVKVSKKVKKNVSKKKVVKSYDIEKNCSVCHNLPKFEEKEKDYLSKKLDFHRKQKRITLTQEEFEALKKSILSKAKK